MTDLSRDPLLLQCYELSGAIERCGASRELTEAISQATRLMLTVAARLQPRRFQDHGPDLYSYVGEPGSHYELLGPGTGAGTDRDHDTMVYRDIVTGQIYTRLPEDFADRMVRASAGLPLKPNDERAELLEWRALFEAAMSLDSLKTGDEQTLWPNPWRQEVAMLAYLIHTLRERLAVHE